MRLTEKELKETFGIRVKLSVEFINYRAYEESIKGIEQHIKDELFPQNKTKLLKIRSQMKKILNDL